LNIYRDMDDVVEAVRHARRRATQVRSDREKWKDKEERQNQKADQVSLHPSPPRMIYMA
jgi:hypothetical protein